MFFKSTLLISGLVSVLSMTPISTFAIQPATYSMPATVIKTLPPMLPTYTAPIKPITTVYPCFVAPCPTQTIYPTATPTPTYAPTKPIKTVYPVPTQTITPIEPIFCAMNYKLYNNACIYDPILY